jgi:hypothetical protein
MPPHPISWSTLILSSHLVHENIKHIALIVIYSVRFKVLTEVTTLKMVTAGSSENMLLICRRQKTTFFKALLSTETSKSHAKRQRYIAEELNLQQHRSENLKSRIIVSKCPSQYISLTCSYSCYNTSCFQTKHVKCVRMVTHLFRNLQKRNICNCCSHNRRLWQTLLDVTWRRQFSGAWHPSCWIPAIQ